MNRKDYMENRVTHEEYYRHIARLAGIDLSANTYFIDKVKKALAAGDEHLNTITLQTWDIMAAGAQLAIKKAMKQIEGEFYSMAGGVCVMKQAALEAASKEMEK